MHIEIVIDQDAQVASRIGTTVPIDAVASALAEDLPTLLTTSSGKQAPVTKRSVDVVLYRFRDDETNYPSIQITVTDVDPSVHDVGVMPYDKVWRVIVDWFNEQRLYLPSTFRYNTGQHGMISVGKNYQSW